MFRIKICGIMSVEDALTVRLGGGRCHRAELLSAQPSVYPARHGMVDRRRRAQRDGEGRAVRQCPRLGRLPNV